MEDNLATYLQLIQEPINRMSTMSSIFKGFCSTIVAGMTGIALTDNVNVIVLFLSLILVFVFSVVDIYYLTLEKRFRYLYCQVLSGAHKCDFQMGIIEFRNIEEMKKAKATIWDCIKSPSIWLFYPIMFVIPIALIIMKGRGCI